MGLSVPEECGGSGANVMTAAVLTEELAYRFPSLATDWLLVSMTARTLREHGSQEQKAELLPRLAAGDFLMAFGMTEPSGGTDVLGLTTRAERDGDGWVVRGQKLFTSFADDADAILVLCRTDDVAGKRARGLSLILTPRDQAGVEVRRLELMGMRAACTCEVFLDDARAPADALVGQRGRGWYHLLSSLDEERILCAAMYVGITAAVLDQALEYAKERTAFGRPIGSYQALQHPLADVATELEQIRLLTQKAAWLQSNGRECASEAAMAKFGRHRSGDPGNRPLHARARRSRAGRGNPHGTSLPRRPPRPLQPHLERDGEEFPGRTDGPAEELLTIGASVPPSRQPTDPVGGVLSSLWSYHNPRVMTS